MPKTLTILIASTAFTALAGLTAWSAMRAPVQTPFAEAVGQQLRAADDSVRMLLVDDDEDENEGGSAKGEDDDHGKCGDDDGEDEDSCGGAAENPAPAGTVAPPQNGLFGNGTAPKVQAN